MEKRFFHLVKDQNDAKETRKEQEERERREKKTARTYVSIMASLQTIRRALSKNHDLSGPVFKNPATVYLNLGSNGKRTLVGGNGGRICTVVPELHVTTRQHYFNTETHGNCSRFALLGNGVRSRFALSELG